MRLSKKRSRVVFRAGGTALVVLGCLATVSAAVDGTGGVSRQASAPAQGHSRDGRPASDGHRLPASPPSEDDVPGPYREARIRAYETAMLGPEHAAEHAAERREAALAPLRGDNALASRADAALSPVGPPSLVGEWTQAPFPIPNYAIHTAVLPTGKVLFWGRPPLPSGGPLPEEGGPRPNVGVAALWSPWLGTGPGAFEDVAPPVIDVDGPGGQPPGPAPIFCSGQSLLPNGDVVVAGGTLIYADTFPNDAYTNYAGLRTIFTFDPFSETWIRQPDLAEGRWYPSQTLLPDGRTIVASGFKDDPPGGIVSNNIEVFNPPSTLGGQGSVEQKPSADRGLSLYPRLFSLRDGNALLAGTRAVFSAILHTNTFTWSDLPDMIVTQRQGGNVVRRPGGPQGSDRFTAIGGYDRSTGPGPFYPATNTSETMDVGQASPSWSADAAQNVARANANTVLLPDGSMVTIGGGSGYDLSNGGGYTTYADGRARQAEVYDPALNSWLLGPAEQEDRAYHSTAVLLPDGRVFSAGDDFHPAAADGSASTADTAEIYSPPYLFHGPRPVIDSAPQTVKWGDDFGISSASPDLNRAVLVAPGATTHGLDTHQRSIELQLLNRLDGQGMNVIAPPSAGAAPPGYYMLFLLNDDGVPSVAKWMKIDPAAPDQPVLGSPPHSALPADFNGDGFADLAAGAPLEDVGAASDAGAVNVIYGSAGGLTGAGNQLFNQDSLEGAGSAEAGDHFGAAVTTADFNQDGFADLAVGAPLENLGSAADSGAVNVIYGSASGLSSTGSQVWSQDSAGIADAAEAGDRLGAALTAGDLNRDGRDELVLGAPSEQVGTQPGAGAVNVIYGSSGGLTSAGNQLWHQNSAAVLDLSESGDRFGAALASGDLNGDARDDLAVGVPSESLGAATGAGAVNVIYGSSGGLTSAGNQLWHQNSTNVLDAAESGDSFGAALTALTLSGDGNADLAVGVPAESVGSTAGAGAVNVIYGSGGGLSSTGNQLWNQDSASVLDAAETGDQLGAALISASP